MRAHLIGSSTIGIIFGFFSGTFFVSMFPTHPIFAITYVSTAMAIFGLVNYVDARDRYEQLKLLTDIATGRDNTGGGYFSLTQWIRDVRELLGLPPIDNDAMRGQQDRERRFLQ